MIWTQPCCKHIVLVVWNDNLTVVRKHVSDSGMLTIYSCIPHPDRTVEWAGDNERLVLALPVDGLYARGLIPHLDELLALCIHQDNGLAGSQRDLRPHLVEGAAKQGFVNIYGQLLLNRKLRGPVPLLLPHYIKHFDKPIPAGCRKEARHRIRFIGQPIKLGDSVCGLAPLVAQLKVFLTIILNLAPCKLILCVSQ